MAAPPQIEHDELQQTRVGRAATLVASFRYAFAGLWYLVRTQRNAQIHLALGMLAIGLGLVFGLERWEWVTLVLICALVLAAEGINTALEAVVDLASPNYHLLAKRAKDVAAGTVLLTALASLVVGALLFLPRFWPLVAGLLGWF
jgi:diacylglycerol kinase